MLEFNEIQALVDQINQSDITEFSFKEGNKKIEIKKQSGQTVLLPSAASAALVQPAAAPAAPVSAPAPAAAAAPAPATPVVEETLHMITSPMVGTFYASPSPDAPPFVAAGAKVSSDTLVCIVEAMKLFNEIEADVSGEIVEVFVKNGQLVEYGQPLFSIRPE